jgi:hypothetical protein
VNMWQRLSLPVQEEKHLGKNEANKGSLVGQMGHTRTEKKEFLQM